MALVEARDLYAVYPSPTGGVPALRGLTLSVGEHEVCVVLGPSGSGKTTLMRLVAGYERPSAGSIVVAGLDLGRASRRELESHRGRVLGYADQHYWRALAGELTAEELVAVPLGLAGVGAADRSARARELLERVGLLDRAHARPGELSGGEQQRIALCAALAHRPKLLVADEPTGELDAATAGEVHALLAELVSEHGATALVVSHDPASTRIADRVVHIRDGRVSEERRGLEETAVVGEGGWLRVPEEILHRVGIGSRVRIVARDGTVELHPAGRRDDTPASPAWVEGAPGGVLEAVGVSRTYGREVALARLDARFEPGELSVVTGPSGSGKSTLLALLAGLDVPDQGEVRLDGEPVSTLDREARAAVRRERVAIVMQGPRLADFLSARENVELVLALRGVALEPSRALAEDALAAVELAEHAERRVGVLSAGQRERVALACAFAARPAVVLADEPTSRLDSGTTLVVGDLLVGLARRTGTTVVCSTHDPLLIALADREVRLERSAGAVRSEPAVASTP
ncbi:MAG TPA: ATP-binding cassette domain-containing protein [Gaiellaceae bacterium]|nr:ATP-binding cassette domain-containing protein [Gaiellaceae bacterium]